MLCELTLRTNVLEHSRLFGDTRQFITTLQIRGLTSDDTHGIAVARLETAGVTRLTAHIRPVPHELAPLRRARQLAVA